MVRSGEVSLWIWMAGLTVAGIVIFTAAMQMNQGQMEMVGQQMDSQTFSQIISKARLACQAGEGTYYPVKINVGNNVKAMYSSKVDDEPPEKVSVMISRGEMAIGNYLCIRFFDDEKAYCEDIGCEVNMTYLGTPAMDENLASLVKENMDSEVNSFEIVIKKKARKLVEITSNQSIAIDVQKKLCGNGDVDSGEECDTNEYGCPKDYGKCTKRACTKECTCEVELDCGLCGGEEQVCVTGSDWMNYCNDGTTDCDNHEVQDEEIIEWEKKMVTVAGDGSGDYNCVGSTCHDVINEALKFVSDNNDEYTTVHLKGPYRFSIDRTIKIGKGNIILEGDSDAVLTVADNFDHDFWAHSDTPLIGQSTISSSNPGKIVIRNFEIDGNHDTVKITDESADGRGDGFYILMLLWYEDLTVYNMYMHDSSGDGLQVRSNKYTKFHNNKVVDLGHDVVFAKDCQNIEYWNNHVKTMTNSAFRAMNSKDIKVHDNVIYTIFGSDAGGPGIQLQLDKKGAVMNNIEIYNNLIYDTYGPGIWLIGTDAYSYTKDQAKDVYIHNNIFYGCGTHPTYGWMAGIVTSGFYDTVIENNVFDGCHGGAVVYLEAYLGAGGTSGKYTTYVRNNIITNTVKLGGNRIVGSIIGDASDSGQAIINYHPSESIIIAENNIIYNNVGGNYKNVESSSDIYQNPLYVDQSSHDYHVHSGSPAIDAGYPSSDYSNEPEPNGGRINIGRYGNTAEATLSG